MARFKTSVGISSLYTPPKLETASLPLKKWTLGSSNFPFGSWGNFSRGANRFQLRGLLSAATSPNIGEGTPALAKPQNDTFLILVGFEARQRYTSTKSTASSWPNHSTAHRPFCSKSSHPPPEQKKHLLDTFHEILLGRQGSLCHGFLKSSPHTWQGFHAPTNPLTKNRAIFHLQTPGSFTKGSEKNGCFKGSKKVSLSF